MKKLTILIGILVIISCGLLATACDEDEPTANLVTPPPQLLELDPCCQGDSPGCTNCQPSGFNDGGAWDPSGSSIQEIALDTVGTKESCWDDVGRWGGKPFWQMVLGISDRDHANNVACFLDELAADPNMAELVDDYTRMRWCSETISYWHMESQIPYSSGYRNGTWLFDWQLISTNAMRDWYEAEEILTQYAKVFPELIEPGRGRWVEWSDLDYQDFEPGVNGPVPGAYVCIKCYDEMGNGGVILDSGHSMLVDEMTIYRTASGEVDSVKITLLEGNTSVGVNWQRYMDDVRDNTPWGTGYFDGCDDGDGMKIIGFGIDLDGNGDPIYDESRLHYVTVMEVHAAEMDLPSVLDDGPQYAAAIAEYIKNLGPDGIKVTSSTQAVAIEGIPDGESNQWHFTTDALAPLSAPVAITVDLMEEHPVPIKGVELNWQGSYLPDGYNILWAGRDGEYKKAQMPAFEGIDLPDTTEYFGPVPAFFGRMGQPVRYIKFVFPPNIFTSNATLDSLRIIHDWGPDTDVDVSPADQKPSGEKPDKRPSGQKPTITPPEKPGITSEEISECPDDCWCAGMKEAVELDLDLCGDDLILCGYFKGTDIPKYCVQKHDEADWSDQVKCPEDCLCMTKEDAELKGMELCQGKKIQCGSDPTGAPLYCYSDPDYQSSAAN